jgi:phosphoribosylaminoimidazole-succinocarboxamide synthase
MSGLNTTNLKSLKKIYSGKVRDLYEIDDKRMLMIATDRLSAFDVILDDRSRPRARSSPPSPTSGLKP